MSEQPVSPFKPTLTDVQSVMAAGAALGGVLKLEAGEEPVSAVMLPPGYTVATYEKFLGSPTATEAHPVFYDPASFGVYVRKYLLEDTVIFADEENKHVEAIIDYHSKVNPHWCSHRASLQCHNCADWQGWLKIIETKTGLTPFLGSPA